MKKTSGILVLLLSFGFFLGAGIASASLTAIEPSGEEPSLDDVDGILDQIYGLENLGRVDDSFDQIWFQTNGGNATAIAKYAAFTHNFGYIPASDGNGAFDETPEVIFNISGELEIPDSGPSMDFDAGNARFIWSLEVVDEGTLWTSKPDVNSDLLDHLVTWEITNGSSMGNYVIAWEDFPGTLMEGSDRDFNDLVIEISGAAPVPIPGAVWMLGSGLVGLVLIRRRFRN